MSGSDWGLWWLALVGRATALAALVLTLSLIARRFGPRLGALIAAWGLGLLVALPLLSLLPGPRWPAPIAPPRFNFGESDRSEPKAVGSGLKVGPSDGEPAEVLEGGLTVAASEPPGPRSEPAAGRRPNPDELAPANAGPSRPERFPIRWSDALALGLAVLSGLGLARFAAALNAVRQLKRRSKAITNPALGEQLDCLRAEMSVLRSVELRETSELSTPATVGWRRPVLFLPDDWSDWQPSELRLVLLHELAHIRRSDYLIGLIAQFTVALYVYHPLVHWLADRLRLDQELDADAVAAGLSGGRRSYLTCLARLALRRDERVVSGPARAFLPTQGAFVRRIDMLRQTRILRTSEPSRPLKGGAVALLFGFATLCAGLQGPEGPGAALARQDVEEAPEAQVVSGFDVTYVPRDAVALLAFRPAALQEKEGLGPITAFLERVQKVAVPSLDPPVERWEQVTGIELKGPGQSRLRGSGPPIPLVPNLVVWKAAEPFDAGRAIAEALEDRVVPRTFLGRSYFPLQDADAIFAPDDRTWVVGSEDAIRGLIADLNRPGGNRFWAEAIEPVQPGQLLVAFESPWLIRLVGEDNALAFFAPLFNDAYSYALTADLSGDLTIDGVAWSGDEEGAGRVGETAEALRIVARNTLRSARDGLRAKSPAYADEIGSLLDTLERLIVNARIEAEGRQTRLRASARMDTAKLVQIVLPALQAANTTAQRSQAMNHLKLIALALHNYHDVHGSFPPPVLYSENGTPYSWRVAILPFLEQNELYERYDFNEPWDSPKNLKVLEQMPPTFDVPGSTNDPTRADFFAIVGQVTLMGPVPEPELSQGREPTSGTTLADVRDGTSNTIAIVEAQRPIPWTKPEDIPFEIVPGVPLGPDQPTPELGGFREGNFLALFADGSVKVISKAVNPMVLQALFTRSGGEVISRDAF